MHRTIQYVGRGAIFAALIALTAAQPACSDDQKINDRHEQILREDEEEAAAHSAPPGVLQDGGTSPFEGKPEGRLV